jgi:Cytochrome c554 and c-prime
MLRLPSCLPLALAVVAVRTIAWATPLATTPADFVQPGTQPSAMTFSNFSTSAVCAQCHGGYRTSDDEPFDAWIASMMAQSARDPVMRAAASIANADATGSAETCIRCHAPIGWLGGRSTGGDFGNLLTDDLDGVSCHLCHRLLDPIARADAPAADAAILAALDQAGTRPGGRCPNGTPCTSDAECGTATCLVAAGQGRFTVDPDDHRRGPRTIPFHLHTTTASPFHSRADACAPCHDVSTPTFTRQPDGTYLLNTLGAAHPTQDPNDMFPEQRTYSEWRASDFAIDGVVFADGRFGGRKTAMLPNTVPVSTCQDCHMPDVRVNACQQGDVHDDVGGHFFAGANAWVVGAVLDEHGAASGLTEVAVTAARGRTEAMLAAAADVDLTQAGYLLTVRVTNQTGHKLPTGYPEGRRLWLGVRFFAGASQTPIAEDGTYDATTATLDVAHTTKIYEVRQVVTADVAAASGLAVGTPLHLVLNGHVAADNRIPPRGFTNAAYDAFGGAPVDATYADGQHWDDTTYTIPLAATAVEVSLYHQTTTREYVEFLRDTTPDATGQNAYDRWVARGKSAPVLMRRVTLDLASICTPDDDPCDDGNPCTTGDTCMMGACTPDATVPCPDDGNACTDDVCVPATGACGAPIAGPCDDGDGCTTGDACGDGACAGALEGYEGLRCDLDAVRRSDVCPAPLPKGLRRAVAQRVRKARALARSAERKQAKGGSAEAIGRLLDAAARKLATLDPKIDAAAASAKPSRAISDECASRLHGHVARELAVLARLRPAATAAATAPSD